MASVTSGSDDTPAAVPQTAAVATNQILSLPDAIPCSNTGSNLDAYSRERLSPAGNAVLTREDSALLGWPLNLQSYLPSLLGCSFVAQHE